MSLDDTYRLTPLEFNVIYKAWADKEMAEYRSGWERARFTAELMLLPYLKKGSKLNDLIVFDWEKGNIQKAPVTTKADVERIRKKYEINASSSSKTRGNKG